jgi:hypothetical protein
MKQFTRRGGRMRDAVVRIARAPALCAALVSASACTAYSGSPGHDVETVWVQSDEFVKLVPQDGLTAARTPPNQHPVTIDPGQLAGALAMVTFHKIDRPLIGFDRNEEVFALLAGGTAERLAPHLARALQEASPQQDVIFAALMWVRAAVVGSSDVTVAGRLFYSGGRLNLIVGDLYRSAVSPDYHRAPVAPRQIDRRLYPHEPGERARETLHDDARFDALPGLQQATVDGHTRQDWLVLDLAALAAPTTQDANAQSAPASGPRRASKAEERLELLKRLHDQGLITDEEFERKHKQIIDEL